MVQLASLPQFQLQVAAQGYTCAESEVARGPHKYYYLAPEPIKGNEVIKTIRGIRVQPNTRQGDH
jgi:hypothetical protein